MIQPRRRASRETTPLNRAGVHHQKECSLKKASFPPVIAAFLFSIGPQLAEPILKNAAAAETTGHFSNWHTSPETGDCGGYEVWLTDRGKSLQGRLAVYEGNCESQKGDLENVHYEPTSGSLSFKAPYYHDDFYWIFKGTLRKDRMAGTFSLFEAATKENTYNDKVILLRDHGK